MKTTVQKEQKEKEDSWYRYQKEMRKIEEFFALAKMNEEQLHKTISRKMKQIREK